MSLQSMMDSAESAPVASRRRRWRGCLTLVLLLAVVVGVGVFLNQHRNLLPIPLPEGCQVDTSDGIVELSVQQMDNAGTIAAVAVSRGLPQQAVKISLATAMQESKLQNLTGGDRDSLGLFQQRPSQGWGTPEQIGDPVFATGSFLDRLVRIPGYAQLPLTVAAQDVQHSAYPDAYEDHEADATTVAEALTGQAPAALSCTVNGVGHAAAGPVGSDALQPGAEAVAQRLTKEYGGTVKPQAVPTAAPAASGATPSGSDAPSAAPSDASSGLVLEAAPGSGAGLGSTQLGWSIAQWAVAHCQDLHISSVEFGGKAWRSSQSAQGWQAVGAASDASAAGGPVRITVAAQ